MESKIDNLNNKIDTINAKLNKVSNELKIALELCKHIQSHMTSVPPCKVNKMKVYEVTSKQGTYAGLKLSDKSIEKIINYAKEHHVSGILDKSKFHSTLLYSRKPLPNYEPIEKFNPPLKGYPTAFDVWISPSNANEGKDTYCLVLKFKCQEQEDRFQKLMDIHNATYDFEEYQPHVTLSYDVGSDFNLETLDASIIGELELISEFKETLTF